jgi:hypothetical protein
MEVKAECLKKVLKIVIDILMYNNLILTTNLLRAINI